MNTTTLIIFAFIVMWGLGAWCGELVRKSERDNYWRGQLALALARVEGEPRSPNMSPAISDWLGRVTAILRGYEQQRQAEQTAMAPESQKALAEAKEAVDDIALFIRENYQREMQLGYHSGRKLGAIVVGYLAVERQYTNQANARHMAAVTSSSMTVGDIQK